MKINCLGASGEVGRSGFLVEDKNTRVLLDYGVKLKSQESESGMELPLPIKGYIDAVLLSHAHLDHSGALPILYQGSECPCYETPPTIPITEILLQDTLKIADINKVEPPFSENNLKSYLRNCRPTAYKKKKNINGMQFEFMDAGHILGASFILMYGNKEKLAYTGDIKYEDTEMHKGAKWPKQNFDVLMTETTYSVDHPPRKELEKAFIDACQETIDKGQPVICPAFALGRSQELVALLHKHDFGVPIFLDGMGKAISEIYSDHLNYLNEKDLFLDSMNKAFWVTNHTQRYKAVKNPSIIVTTSGMLNGGPVADYLFKLKNRKAGLFLTGYQVEGTPGRTLLETGMYVTNKKKKNLNHLDIRKFDFSAHAGISGLKKAVKRSNPKLVLAIHGDQENAEIFKEQVEQEMGVEVVIPKFGDTIDTKDHY